MLRTLGDLTAAEVRERVLDALDADVMLAELTRERRAVAVRVAREQRYIAAQDAGLYRDALGQAEEVCPSSSSTTKYGWAGPRTPKSSTRITFG